MIAFNRAKLRENTFEQTLLINELFQTILIMQ